MNENRGIGTAGALIILVVVVLLGIVGIMAFKKDSKNTTSSSTTASVASLSSVVDKVKTEVPSKYKAQNVVAQDTAGYRWGVMYSVPNFDSLVRVEKNTNHVMLRNSDAKSPIPATVADEVIGKLKGNGFTEVSKAPVDPRIANSPNVTATYFSRKTDVCHLTIEKIIYTVTLDCATQESFKKAAAAAKPFLATYIDNTQAKANQLAIGEPEVTTSKSGEYQYAQMYIAQLKDNVTSTAYFYTKKTGDIWHFARQSQDLLSCESLSTPDAKAAFQDVCVYGNR